MPQLPNIPGAVWGVGPTTKTDGAGVLFLSAFANDAQRVYKLVGGAWQEVALEHTPTARGELDIDSDGRAYLTAWDDKAVGGPWRIPIRRGLAPTCWPTLRAARRRGCYA